MSARSFVVLGPDTVRETKQLACALRTARDLADRHPGVTVNILETMPSRGTVTPRWPLACVVSHEDPDTRGIVREIDWSMA